MLEAFEKASRHLSLRLLASLEAGQGAGGDKRGMQSAAMVTPVLGKRRREHGSGLGKFRWYVERTIAWLHSFGRLRRRLDRLTEIQEAFLRLACSLICLGFLTAQKLIFSERSKQLGH
jgi:uncharacterized Ntn-hydrolase superfamily protein